MSVEEKTLSQLVEFFSQNQDLIPTISRNSADPDIWDKIFVFFYKEKPIHVTCSTHPLKRRPGSTDPRWDELLHEKKATHALTLFLKKQCPISLEAT